jgi:Flp pilus assembly protein TadB
MSQSLSLNQSLPLVIAGLLGLSAATLCWAASSAARDVLGGLARSLWWGRARRRLVELARSEEEKPDDLPSLDQLYGMPPVSWPALMLASGLAGWVIFVLAFQLVPFMQLAGLAAAAVPIAARSYLRARGQQKLRRQVTRFVTDLRLSLAFTRSLGRSLHYLAGDAGPNEAADPRGILFTRLRQYLRTRMAPEEILERLSRDLRSKELQDLLERVDAATRGNVTYAEALSTVAASMWSDECARAEEQVQSASTRMILPMVATLMGPLLVLAMLPAVYRVLAGLTAVSH